MTPQDKEHLDISLLRKLETNHTRFGLTAEALASLVRPLGCRYEAPVIVDRIEYLVERGLAAPVAKTINKAIRVWQITDAGREFLDESGY